MAVLSTAFWAFEKWKVNFLCGNNNYNWGNSLEAYAVLGKLADIEKRLDLIEDRLKRIESKLEDIQRRT